MIFEGILTDRKWMKSAKSYRLHFELDSLEAAVAMTDKIEQNVAMQLTCNADTRIGATLEPCHIVDVPYKAKKFTLVCETCSESQNFIGKLFTPAIGDKFSINMFQAVPDTPPPASQQADKDYIKTLHHLFFNNTKFWQYISYETGEPVSNNNECKAAYKLLHKINSCKDLPREQYIASIEGFNAWLNRKQSA